MPGTGSRSHGHVWRPDRRCAVCRARRCAAPIQAGRNGAVVLCAMARPCRYHPPAAKADADR